MAAWLARLRFRPDYHPVTLARRPPWIRREVAEYRDAGVARSDADGLSRADDLNLQVAAGVGDGHPFPGRNRTAWSDRASAAQA